jgi:hypothetical protein
VRGTNRVEGLVTEQAGEVHVLPCESVVLAADLRPLRNVDGAITDAHDVTYVQPTAATLAPHEAIEFARKAAAALTVKEPR